MPCHADPCLTLILQSANNAANSMLCSKIIDRRFATFVKVAIYVHVVQCAWWWWEWF